MFSNQSQNIDEVTAVTQGPQKEKVHKWRQVIKPNRVSNNFSFDSKPGSILDLLRSNQTQNKDRHRTSIQLPQNQFINKTVNPYRQAKLSRLKQKHSLPENSDLMEETKQGQSEYDQNSGSTTLRKQRKANRWFNL